MSLEILGAIALSAVLLIAILSGGGFYLFWQYRQHIIDERGDEEEQRPLLDNGDLISNNDHSNNNNDTIHLNINDNYNDSDDDDDDSNGGIFHQEGNLNIGQSISSVSSSDNHSSTSSSTSNCNDPPLPRPQVISNEPPSVLDAINRFYISAFNLSLFPSPSPVNNNNNNNNNRIISSIAIHSGLLPHPSSSDSNFSIATTKTIVPVVRSILFMSGLMDFCYCSRNQHFFNHHLSESESLLRNLRISPVIPIDGLGVVIDENNHQQHQHHLDPEVELTLLTAETMLARCLSETVLQQREIQGDFHLRKSFSLYIQVLRSDISLSSLFSKDPYTNCTHDFPVRDRRCRIIEGLFFGFGTMNALSMLYPEQLGPILKQLFKDTAGSTYHLYEQEGKLLRIVACGNGYRAPFSAAVLLHFASVIYSRITSIAFSTASNNISTVKVYIPAVLLSTTTNADPKSHDKNSFIRIIRIAEVTPSSSKSLLQRFDTLPVLDNVTQVLQMMNSKMRKSNHSSSSPSSSLNHSLLCFFYKRIGLLDLAMMQAKCALAQTSQPQYPILPLVPAFELARLMCLQAQYTLADAHIQSVWTHIYSSGGNDAVDEEFSAMVDAFYIGVKNITTSSKRTEISKLIDTIISTSLLRASSESKSEKLRKSRAKSFRKLILDTYSSHSPTTLLLLTLHFSNDLECISMSGLGLVQSLFEKDVPSVETTSQMSPPDCLAAALVFKHIAQEQWLATLSLEVSRDTTSLDASPYTPLFLKRTESLLIKCIDHTYNLFHSAIFSSSGNNHSPALMTLDSSNLDSFYWCAPHASLELALVVGALARRDMCRLYLRQCTKSGCISLNTASSATVTNTTPRTPKKPVDIPAILATGSSSHSPSLSFKRHFASSYNSVSSPINVEEEAESEANTTSLSNCSSMSNSFVSSIGSTSVILLNASPSHPQQQQHQSLSSSAKFSRRVPKFIFHDQWLAQCSRSLDASKGQKVK